MNNPTRPPVCNYEGSDYQQSFWEGGGRAYEDGAEAVALRRLLPSGGRRLLELGAGAGRNTPRYRGFDQVTLVDYSLTQLQQAVRRLGAGPAYRYVAADVYRLPFAPGVFDAATMIRTLHHMADAPLALAQVGACLQDGAVFILEFANKHNLKAIARYWLGKQAWSPFTREPVEFTTLNFDFHPAAVRTWLQDCGFTIQRTLTVSHFRAALFKRLLPTGLLVRLDALASLSGGWWQLSPSVFMRCLAKGAPTAGWMGAFFRCPACGHTPLPDTPPELVCPACARRFPVVDGIYDLRV